MMRCPHCDRLGTVVAETRPQDEARVVHRRRRCTYCGKTASTVEIVADIRDGKAYIITPTGRRYEATPSVLADTLAWMLGARRPGRAPEASADEVAHQPAGDKRQRG